MVAILKWINQSLIQHLYWIARNDHSYFDQETIMFHNILQQDKKNVVMSAQWKIK